MAKISAHGSHKVKEISYDLYRERGDLLLGDTTRCFFVLRSDGAILRAYSWPDAQSSYDRRRSGYTIAARVKKGHDIVAVFDRFVARRTARQGITLNV